ncbi:hypothetical protein [Coleofasciculus sp. FACHB-1120]|uniref:hypothetical protein n=1 Tax=Coleofasciculus sp. FACHB-1120 TaxID=2692783 RepID=UPI00168418BE|nr:hypothetical protein [Coleofasciculus sp. FACHB-1120]MBD2743269.1 hypothetical protein [Coleofasciculus sp. FACHB-1120]
MAKNPPERLGMCQSPQTALLDGLTSLWWLQAGETTKTLYHYLTLNWRSTSLVSQYPENGR